MKPAAFHYKRPADLPSALALLDKGDDARILAGGQSLVPMMNFRLAQPECLIDINRIPELDYIREDGDMIVIGALARHNDVKSSSLVERYCPVVVQAYDWVAHAAVRNRGTLCGNICHADPASEMPAVMQALEAHFVLNSVSGSRSVAATNFFLGLYETAAEPREMMTEIRIPKRAPGVGWGFEEVSMRKGDFAWATIVCTLRLGEGTIADARIAAAGVGDRAVRLTEVEAALQGKAPSADLFADAAAQAAAAIDPNDTQAVSAEYRRDLVRALVPRALAAATARARS